MTEVEVTFPGRLDEVVRWLQAAVESGELSDDLRLALRRLQLDSGDSLEFLPQQRRQPVVKVTAVAEGETTQLRALIKLGRLGRGLVTGTALRMTMNAMLQRRWPEISQRLVTQFEQWRQTGVVAPFSTDPVPLEPWVDRSREGLARNRAGWMTDAQAERFAADFPPPKKWWQRRDPRAPYAADLADRHCLVTSGRAEPGGDGSGTIGDVSLRAPHGHSVFVSGSDVHVYYWPRTRMVANWEPATATDAQPSIYTVVRRDITGRECDRAVVTFS